MIVIKINLVKNIILTSDYSLTLNKILKEVCLFMDVKESEMKGKMRHRHLTDARAIFLTFSFKFIAISGTEIAYKINKHHSLVVYSQKKCAFVLKKLYKEFEELMENKYTFEEIKRYNHLNYE